MNNSRDSFCELFAKPMIVRFIFSFLLSGRYRAENVRVQELRVHHRSGIVMTRKFILHIHTII